MTEKRKSDTNTEATTSVKIRVQAASVEIEDLVNVLVERLEVIGLLLTEREETELCESKNYIDLAFNVAEWLR